MPYDWNHNGKSDMLDSFFDYQLCQEVFGDNDDDSGLYGSSYNASYQGGPYVMPTNYHSYSSEYGLPKKMKEQEDLYGIKEIERKRSIEILGILFQRKKNMADTIERCSLESGIRRFFDNTQMIKDFWLYAFARILEDSKLDDIQKVSLLQKLLDVFHIDNPMSAEAHYRYMKSNEQYRNYMNNCFGITYGNCGTFWVILGMMSGNDGERMGLTMNFTNEYIKFLMQLEVYLRQIFWGKGFENHMKRYIMELLESVMHSLSKDTKQFLVDEYMINPLFPPENIK